MAFPEIRNLDLNEDPATPGTALVGNGDIMDVRQMSEKGYEINRGLSAVFAGNIEGSVSGTIWTVISAIGASAQGAIAAQYNYVRLTVGTGGLIGADSHIKIAGKVL